MNYIGFASSLRSGSMNLKLLEATSRLASELGHTLTLVPFKDVCPPIYNGDLDKDGYLPDETRTLISLIKNTDGIFIANPEYNHGISGALKNLIDWVSRAKPMPLKDVRILLLSASPSLVGGNRGLWHTRMPLEANGAFVYPNMFSLAAAHQAFDESGHLKDETMRDRLKKVIESFSDYTEQLSL